MAQKTETPSVAYSYIRFSHPDQSKGDSLRRQMQAAADWSERSGVPLDTSLNLRDLGTSAFTGAHRRNPDRNALAAFLKLIEEGKIPHGSYLLIENLDRLSREDEVPACHLLTGILMAGVRVVQLIPSEMLLTEKSNGWELMRAVMELSRGHNESLVKSDRLGEVWGDKKQAARGEKTVQTTRAPGWLEVSGRSRQGKHAVGGEFRVLPERAAAVQLIFDLACSGHGLALIVNRLTEGRVPTFGRSGKWSKAYVHKILTGRAVLGEYQPMAKGKPDGTPIPGYYPRVVEDDAWLRAQGALATRKGRPGRIGARVTNLFSGLLMDSRTQSKILVASQTQGSGKRVRRVPMLVAADSIEGRAPTVSFSNATFEAAILSKLREVNSADVIGNDGPLESVALADEFRSLESRLKQMEAVLAGDDGDIATLARAAKQLEDRRDQVAKKLAAAQQREANPLGRAWGEAKGLWELARDEKNRLRLRGVLQRIIDRIWILVVPRRSHKLVAVQIHFAGGTKRDYLIHSRAAGYCRVGGWEVRSLAGSMIDGELDLGNWSHARKLEEVLASSPL